MTAIVRFNILRSIAILICIAAISVLIKPVFGEDATSPAAARREAIKEKMDARKTAIQQKRDAFQEKVETRKENIESKIAAMREKVASHEAAFKAKLEAFKDKRKAEIAERVNTNLNKINQNYTDQMKKHLETMSAILDKLEARVNSNSPDIKDPTAAKTAIAEARAKIAAATAAVDAQAQKDYTITVTSESKVRADAQKMRDLLKTDIQALRKQLIDAKQSVSNAIRTAKSGSDMKEGSQSGQQ